MQLNKNKERNESNAGLLQKTAENHGVIPHKLLLIEDDEPFAEVLALALEERAQCDVIIALDSFEAANQMSIHAFDLIITDWRLPPFTGFGGLRLADHALALDPLAPEEWFLQKKTPVIVLTAADMKEVERGKKLRGRFQFMGVISKNNAVAIILDQIEALYGNFPKPMASAIA